MIVAIHQPEHLPWLGFFDKLRQADVWVMLDHVQYRKHYFQHRNRVHAASGAAWVTVPVSTSGRLSQPLSEVRIDPQAARWRQKCWGTIAQWYQRAPYWAMYAPELEALYQREWERLVDLNDALIRFLLSALSIHVRIVKSSTLGVEGARSGLLLEICSRLGARTYLSGISGREYLDVASFQASGVAVRFQTFHHPVYPQQHAPFVPCLSAIDLLFNCGPSSRMVLQGIGVETMSELFT